MENKTPVPEQTKDIRFLTIKDSICEEGIIARRASSVKNSGSKIETRNSINKKYSNRIQIVNT